MKGNFISNLAFLLFVNVLVKPFWILGVDRSVQNHLGSEVYGTYFALFNFAFILSMLLDMGITFYNNKKIASDPTQIHTAFPLFLKIKALLAVFYILFCSIVGYLIGFELFQLQILIVLLINQSLMSLILFLRSNMGGLHFFRTEGMISVADKILMIIFIGSLLWLPFVHNFNLYHFLLGQTAALGIVAFSGFLWVYKKAKPLNNQHGFQDVKIALRNTLPYATLVMMMSIYSRVDGFMIERLLPGSTGAEQAGIYAASYRLLDAVFMIGFLFSTLLLPMFSRMLAAKESVQHLVDTSSRLLFFGAVSVVSVCWFYREPIMDLLYWEADTYWATVFGYLMITFLFTGLNMVFSTLLTANNNLRYLNSLAIIGVVANIILNWYLILNYAALGAVYATLFTQAFICSANLITSIRKNLYVPTVKQLLSIFLFAFSAVLVSYFLTLPETVNWVWKIVLTLIAISLLSLLTGLITKAEITRLLSMIRNKGVNKK